MNDFNFFNNFVMAAPLEAFSLDCYYKSFGVRTSLIAILVSVTFPLVLCALAIVLFYLLHIYREGMQSKFYFYFKNYYK